MYSLDVHVKELLECTCIYCSDSYDMIAGMGVSVLTCTVLSEHALAQLSEHPLTCTPYMSAVMCTII